MNRRANGIATPRSPLARGHLAGPLTWHRDPDDPSAEIGECRIVIPCCPLCGSQHSHWWRLDGSRRVETRRSHCGRGEIRLTPAALGNDWSPSGASSGGGGGMSHKAMKAVNCGRELLKELAGESKR